MAKYQYVKKYSEGSNVSRGRMDQLKKQVSGPERNFSNLAMDTGKWMLNQALTPIETITGRNFYDPEFAYDEMNQMDAVTSGVASAATDIVGTYFGGPFYTYGKKATQGIVNKVDADGSWDNTNAQVAMLGGPIHHYGRGSRVNSQGIPRYFDASSVMSMFGNSGGGGGGGFDASSIMGMFGGGNGGGGGGGFDMNSMMSMFGQNPNGQGMSSNTSGNIQDFGSLFNSESTGQLKTGMPEWLGGEGGGYNQSGQNAFGQGMNNAKGMNMNQHASLLTEGDVNTMTATNDAQRNTRNWSGVGNFVDNLKSDTVQETKAKEIKQQNINNAQAEVDRDSDMMTYSSEGAGDLGVVSQGNAMNNAYIRDAVGTSHVQSGWADKTGQAIAQVGSLVSNYVGGDYSSIGGGATAAVARDGGKTQHPQDDPTFKMWYAKNARRPDVMKAGNTDELKAIFLKEIGMPGNEMPLFSGEIDGYGNVDKSNRTPELNSRIIGGMNRHGGKAKYNMGSKVKQGALPPGLNVQNGVLNVPENYEGYFTIPGNSHEDGGTFMNTPAEGQGNTLIEAELNEGAEVKDGETYIYSKTTKHPDTGETFKKRKDKREKESLQIDKLLANSDIQKDEYKLNALTRRKTTLLLEEESDRNLQDEIKQKNELKDTLELEGLLASNTNITQKGTYRRGGRTRKLNENQKTMLGDMLSQGVIETYQDASTVKKPNPADYKWGPGGGWKAGGEDKYNKALQAYKDSKNTNTEETNVSPNVENPITIPATNDSVPVNNNVPVTNPQPNQTTPVVNTDDDLPFSTEIDDQGNTRYMVNGVERSAEEYDALVKQWNDDPENFATIPMAPGSIDVKTHTEGPITVPPVTNIEGQNLDLNIPPVNNNEVPPVENPPVEPPVNNPPVDNNNEELPENFLEKPRVGPLEPDNNEVIEEEVNPNENRQNEIINNRNNALTVDPLNIPSPNIDNLDPNSSTPPADNTTPPVNNTGEVAPPNQDLLDMLEQEQQNVPAVTDNRTTENNQNVTGDIEIPTDEDKNNVNAGPDGVIGTADDHSGYENATVTGGDGTETNGGGGCTNGTCPDGTGACVPCNQTANNTNLNNNTNNNNKQNNNNNNSSSSSSSSYQFMEHDINPYDWLGMAGLTHGALAGAANTKENYDKTPPNINFMKDVYKKPIHRLNMNTEIIDAANMNTDRQLREDLNTQLQRIRTSGNSFQNVDARSQNAYNTYASNAIDADVKYGLMNLGLQKDIADLEGKDRKMFLEGEGIRDVADREDMDNYYTQRGKDIQNTAKNMMEMAKNGNSTAMEWMKANAMNNLNGGNEPLDVKNNTNHTDGTTCPGGNCNHADHTNTTCPGPSCPGCQDPNCQHEEIINNDNDPNNNEVITQGENTNTFYNVSSGNNFETNFSGDYEPGTAGHFQEFARGMNLDLGDFGASGTEWEGVDNNIGKYTTAAWDISSNAYRDYLERSGTLGNLTGINEPSEHGGTQLPFRRRLSPEAGTHSSYTNYGKFDNAQDYYNSLPADQQQILKQNDAEVFGDFRYGSRARRRPRKYQDAHKVLSDKVVENYSNLGITSDMLNSMNVAQGDTVLTSTIYPNEFNYNSGDYDGEAGNPTYNPELNAASSGVVMENLNMGDITLNNSREGNTSSINTIFGHMGVGPTSRTDVTDDGTTETTTDYNEEDFNKADVLKRFYATNKHAEDSEYMESNWSPYSFDFQTILNNEGSTKEGKKGENKQVLMKMLKEPIKRKHGGNVMSNVLTSRQRNQATADQRMNDFRNFMKNRK